MSWALCIESGEQENATLLGFSPRTPTPPRTSSGENLQVRPRDNLGVLPWLQKQVRATSVVTCLLKTLRSLGQLTIVG